MKVGDIVKVKVSFGRYDCYEDDIIGYIEAIYPDPPTDPKVKQYYDDMEKKYPGFWKNKKTRDNTHFTGLFKWCQGYWIHITDKKVSEYADTTSLFYDSEVTLV